MDLAEYGEKNAKKFKLPLEKCKYEGSYIEVTLQRVMPKDDLNMSKEEKESRENETEEEAAARKEAEEKERQEDMQSLYAAT